MSLEAKIDALTAAVVELTTISKALHSLRADAIEQVKGAAASTKSAAKSETKSEKKAEAVAETKANISTEPENRSEPADGGLHEEARNLVGKYVGGTEREDERAARKAKVKKLLNHEKIKKPDVAEPKGTGDIMDSALPTFISNMKKLIEAGDITEAPKKAADDLDI